MMDPAFTIIVTPHGKYRLRHGNMGFLFDDLVSAQKGMERILTPLTLYYDAHGNELKP